jgi:hypothetical protein
MSDEIIHSVQPVQPKHASVIHVVQAVQPKHAAVIHVVQPVMQPVDSHEVLKSQ